MARLFVAIPLPRDVRDRLLALCSGLPGARWVEPDNIHLTLRFIGEVADGEVREIAGALARVDAPAFALSLAGVYHFGSARRARTLWAGVDRQPDLALLYGRVEQSLRRAGIAPDDRKFTPHVTLARLKGTPPPRLASYVQTHNLFRAGPFPVTEFALFRSFLSQDGAIHRIEAEFPLRNS